MMGSGRGATSRNERKKEGEESRDDEGMRKHEGETGEMYDLTLGTGAD